MSIGHQAMACIPPLHDIFHLIPARCAAARVNASASPPAQGGTTTIRTPAITAQYASISITEGKLPLPSGHIQANIRNGRYLFSGQQAAIDFHEPHLRRECSRGTFYIFGKLLQGIPGGVVEFIKASAISFSVTRRLFPSRGKPSNFIV